MGSISASVLPSAGLTANSRVSVGSDKSPPIKLALPLPRLSKAGEGVESRRTEARAAKRRDGVVVCIGFLVVGIDADDFGRSILREVFQSKTGGSF